MTWPTTRLRYVADLNPSIRKDLLSTPETEVSFLPMEAIGEDGSLCLDRNRPVSEVRNGYTYFEDGDVAFAKVTPCFENGKGALMRNLLCGAGFGTSELTVLRPRPGTNARFLNYVLQSEPFRRLGVGAMTGAGGLKRVPDDFTRDFVVAWPNATIQEFVANFLDEQTARIDALIAEKERLCTLLTEFDRETLRAELIPSGVMLSKLKWAIELSSGAALPESFDKDSGSHPAFGSNGQIGWCGEWNYGANTIVVGRVGSCGAIAVLSENSWVSDNALTVTATSKLTTEFLALSLEALELSSLAGGTAMPLITGTMLKNQKIWVPPLAEQVRVVRAFNVKRQATHSLIEHARQHVTRLREYRVSLISAAVTGQLDINSYKEVA